MDALTGKEPLDPEAALRAAQDALLQAERKAVSEGDPIATSLHALRAWLSSFGSAARDYAAATRRDTDALRDVQTRLDQSMRLAVEAARADVSKAHAEMAHSLVGSISARAHAELAKMSTSVWWRTVVLASAIPLLALSIGVGAGYWRGYQVGHYAAATTIRTAAPLAQSILANQGPAALHDWNVLMRDNGIVPAMKTFCHGTNIAKQNGRTACHIWLWLTPYAPSPPDGGN